MVGIRSCYDEGKCCAETLFSDYGRRKRVIVKTARIFNTYAPGMPENDGRMVSNFIVQALYARDLTIYGDGNQLRALCFMDDMIDGLVRLMNSVDTFRGPDILLARRHLDWAPTVTLEDGLRQTIAHFDQALKAPATHSRAYGTARDGYRAFSG